MSQDDSVVEEGTSTSPGSSEVTVAGQSDADAADPDFWDAFQWDTREDCEVRQILDRIADKWSLLVISLLAERTLRFTELRREIDGTATLSMAMSTPSRNRAPHRTRSSAHSRALIRWVAGLDSEVSAVDTGAPQ